MNATMTAQQIIKRLEEWSPKTLAYDWDNVGLQVGSLNKPVRNVMVTLDVLENVVDEAVEKNVDLIIAHHPLLFVKLHQINFDTPKGRVVRKLIQHDITVYAAHTNLDIASGGVNDVMADALGLKDTRPLMETGKEELVKLVVFVPETHASNVQAALGYAGAGHIGNYSHCSYQSKGHGAFLPLEGTDPYLGESGKLETVDEVRLETIVEKRKLKDVLRSMEEAHPYEEVAYDIYPLLNEGASYGLGRIGELDAPEALELFAEKVKVAYEIPALRVTGRMDKQVKKVAVLGGSGEKYIHAAKRMGADVYITGDMTLHAAQDALEIGLAVIDPGHHVEKLICPVIKDFLEQECNKDERMNIMVSEAVTEPFTFQ